MPHDPMELLRGTLEWISSEWRTTENNRRARYYMLTPAGERERAYSADSSSRPPSTAPWEADS